MRDVLLALGAIYGFTCAASHLIYFYLKNKRYKSLELTPYQPYQKFKVETCLALLTAPLRHVRSPPFTTLQQRYEFASLGGVRFVLQVFMIGLLAAVYLQESVTSWNLQRMALLHRSPCPADCCLAQDNPFSINCATLDEFQQVSLPGGSEGFHSPEKLNLYTHEIDFLGADSLHTIPRGSLQIVPDPNAIELSEHHPDNYLPPFLRHSQSSLLFFEELESENEELQARKLIVETHELSLRESSRELGQDIFNSPPVKGRRIAPRRQHHIKEVRGLVRELKRVSKYRDKIVGDVVLKGEGFTKRVKQAVITTITNMKGELEGLVIDGAGEEMKVRLLEGGRQSQSKMELWDASLESWLQLQFKIRLAAS